MTINERLFNELSSKKITMSALAKKLNVNKTVISSWKNRKTDPPSTYLVQICELIEVSIEFLVTGKNTLEELTENEKEMIQHFRQLPEKEQLKEIGRLETLTERRNDNAESESTKSKTG